MSYKGKTYSRKGGGGGKGNPFDRMMKEQCNKPVAAKSAGIVGKWGATSFTSIRTGDQPPPQGAPRVKKFFKSRTQENSDSPDPPSSGEATLVTVSAAAVLPPSAPPAKKFFKKSRAVVEVEEKEEEVESKEEEAPPSSRPRPRRPSQRTGGMSPRPPVPRSPLQARSPLQVKSPLQETSPRQSPRSPQPVTRVARKPPAPRSQSPPPPLSASPPHSLASLPSSTPPSPPPAADPFDSLRSRKRGGKRRLEEEEGGEGAAVQPPLKLKLSLTKSPVKGGATEFEVVGKEGRGGQEVKRRGRPPGGPSPLPPQGPPSPTEPPARKKSAKAKPPVAQQDEPRAPSPIERLPSPTEPPARKKSVKRPSAAPQELPRAPSPLERPPSPASKPPSPKPQPRKKVKRPAEVEEPPVRPPSPPLPLPTAKRKAKQPQAPRAPSPVQRPPTPPSPPSPPPTVKRKPKRGVEEAGDGLAPLPMPQRKEARKPLSPVQGTEPPLRAPEPPLRAPSPDLEVNFPARIAARAAAPRPQASTKKSIFKSRSKPEAAAPAPRPAANAPRAASPAPAPFLEEPRVPLISSSFDLFKAWDKEIPSTGAASDTEEDEPKEKKGLPKEAPREKPAVKTFSRSKKEEVMEEMEEVKPPPEPPKPFVAAPRPSRPVYARPDAEAQPAISSPEFKINFPARIDMSVPPSQPPLASGRVLGQKRSIFKSKAKENTAPPKKALSMYKHCMGWGGEREARSTAPTEQSSSQPSTADLLSSYDDSEFEEEQGSTQESDLSFAPGKLTRVATYPATFTGTDEDGDMVTQVKCPKSYKEYYTVIKKVKKAHEMNDMGEYQEFADDVEYIADGLKVRNSTAARCLAAVSLAQKCMKPSFRMHLRAHGEVSKFFVELKDAPTNPSLALCTSTILFVLSQDRLNMDMDRDSLELMLNLLDTDCNIQTALAGHRELAKNKQKVIDICTEMKAAGHAGSLNIDLLSADHLAMETLLSMTSKRAGEWFKEELRELGGLGHLARTLSDCSSYLTVKKITSWTDALTDKLKKANRILRVLENVSHENEENCNYLVAYGRAGGEEGGEEFLEVLQSFFKLLDEEVQLNPTTDTADREEVGSVLRDTLFSLVRVHINIVHDYRPRANGSLHVGQKQGCIGRVLRCLFIMPYWFCPLNKRFEALVLALTLLINMVEHCEENRQSLMDSMAAQKELDNFCVKEEPRMAVEDLVQLFVDRDTLAKMSEEKTDNILDDVEEEVQEVDPKEEGKDAKPTLDDTVQKLIGKAGNHMESTLIAAYVGLIIGYLIINSEDYECRIREYLPSRDFKAVVSVLHKMYNFMKMTALGTVSSSKGLKATEKIIQYLEKIDAEPVEEEEEEETCDYTLFNVSAEDTTLLQQDTSSIDQSSYTFDDWGKL